MEPSKSSEPANSRDSQVGISKRAREGIPEPSAGPSAGLPRSRTAAGEEGLAALLARPRGALIGFDFDGTVAPIVADPEAARAHPDVGPALRRLAPAVGLIAVVTGRPAAVALEYGDFAAVPGLIILGQYGRERWADGRLHAPGPPAGVDEARRRLPALLAEAGAPEGTWIEDKGHAVAVHTRRTAEPEPALERLRRPLATLAGDTGLVVEPGRLVLELRPPGMDKGAALLALVAEGAGGEREVGAVLYAGDDLGDLAAYDAVDRLRARGVPGVTVCSASAETTELAERADIVVDGPAGVAALLAALATALGS
jgi:trehalose 6-phosphate phosphatase